MPDMLTIEKYEPAVHHSQLLQCLQELQESKSSYPPKDTITNIQPTAAEWLSDEGEDAHRFVAMLEGRVVGHIGISALHDYMVKFLKDNSFVADENETELRSYVEIGTFFVSPSAQKHGVGGKLFAHILAETRRRGKIPALAVVESHDSHKATQLYQRHGMLNVGYFHGTHGKNLIFINKY
jgi:GNAT superfamily N-acetyltransferase